MYNKNEKLFNPLTCPIHGVNLIEASAGTGKTYALIRLYVRLLLGIYDKNQYIQKLNIENIVIVTFTRAHTENLREKIKKYINHLRLSCMDLWNKKDEIFNLLSSTKNNQKIIFYLQELEQNMDKANIFTIHEFCKYILQQHAIETGTLIKKDIIENGHDLYRETCNDFWRKYFYILPEEIISILQQYWKTPNDLLHDLMPYFQGMDLNIYKPPMNKNETIILCHYRIKKYINKLKKAWYQSRNIIKNILNDYHLNPILYNNKNIINWITNINQWAKITTTNYYYPNEIKYFETSFLKKNSNTHKTPEATIFKKIENLYETTMSLKKLVFILAKNEIFKEVEKKKQSYGKIEINDLLNILNKKLSKKTSNNISLANIIKYKYPIAMIDEFQDTDPKQYHIFKTIYYKKPYCGLFLIGDPKQAIYSFRGADIFTYIRARQEADNIYYLNINWRSSRNIINATNYIFQKQKLPFIFKEINFFPAINVKNNNNLKLIIQNKEQPGICCWTYSKNLIEIHQYRNLMANICAKTICDLINKSKKGTVWIQKENKKSLKTSDFAILVRNKIEANIIQSILINYNIPTVYLSNNDNIFKTTEAHELLQVLMAIVQPEKINTLRCALITNYIGFNAYLINKLNVDEKKWKNIIKTFLYFNTYWENYGILLTIKKILQYYKRTEKIFINNNGKKQLSNMLYLGELLQEASIKIKDKYKLISWLSIKITSTNSNIINQKERLEDNNESIKIFTIHKSKGLEFSIVFLPFISDFYQHKKIIFNDKEKQKTWIDLSQLPKNVALTEKERLSEELRLLYVAITRSICQCYLGIAPIIHNKNKKQKESDLHKSAIGYLLQEGQPKNADSLKILLNTIQKITNNNITIYKEININIKNIKKTIDTKYYQISTNKKRTNNIKDIWSITSYTDLTKYNKNINTSICTDVYKKSMGNKKNEEEKTDLTPYTFPKGNTTGILLHKIFEKIIFSQTIDIEILTSQIQTINIHNEWIPIIKKWITSIINTPLNNENLLLSHLKQNNYLTELKFHLPINNTLIAKKIDDICKQYDPLSSKCPILEFPNIKGMLKGSIDLFFFWKHRYYILDYKTNWLGEYSKDYNKSKIKNAMISHRYELQYQLYTLAIHRFLKHRIKEYKYKQNFGGVFYLFIRGIDPLFPGNGTFFYRPKEIMIKKLDKLFINNKNNNI